MAEAGFTLLVLAQNVCSGMEGPAVGWGLCWVGFYAQGQLRRELTVVHSSITSLKGGKPSSGKKKNKATGYAGV